MKSAPLLLVAGLLAAACGLAWWYARPAFLAAYLTAWWFSVGTVMGGLANAWVHNLTGGEWGEALRPTWLRLSRRIGWLVLLFVPLLAGLDDLYPWVSTSLPDAPAAAAGFRHMWLSPIAFQARSVVYLVAWMLLAWLSARPSLARSRGFSALALLVYGVTASLAAADWIMSLTPAWYSSVFGLLAVVGQMLSGMALAVWVASRQRAVSPSASAAALAASSASASLFGDFGNLLLAYVMTWAYLAFTQFLIIWAANLPHEVIWYIDRSRGGWPAVAQALALFHFFAPLLILLFRRAKQAPRILGSLAAFLLLMRALDACWTVLPSTRVPWHQLLWVMPLTGAAFGMLGFAVLARASSAAVAVHAGGPRDG